MDFVKLLVILSYIVIGSVLGIVLIPEIVVDFEVSHPPMIENSYFAAFMGTVLMFLLFGWFIPRIAYAIKDLEQFVLGYSAIEIIFATIGLFMGLLISVMISFILEFIGTDFINRIIPIILTLILSYLGFQFGLKKRDEMLLFLPENMARSMAISACNAVPKIIDTSAIIDGRILKIMEAGFIDGEILIPQGVINELQVVADANDSIKRDKGRRGLEILNAIHMSKHPTRIVHPQRSHHDIDDLLVRLAQHYRAHVITTDYNLNKVCSIQGIKVLNVNDLSDAIRPEVHQGDRFDLMITKVGKEPGQGVGYFDDGTMVVVDDAKQYINQTIPLEVISMLQTASGRIIFAKKVEE
ncbi:PIN/TRAM domain-containing protein [Staphylococcus schleiferi]|uniref:PIN/TRAM domain-containing protein n=1 Tax=Staphylococcus schleiferi TaxID=1295 RepID=UPI0021D17C6B|nr:PIN/TRAM domain-containing protein [Staphylococcus schleiferi]UXR54804.1 PIN/TRAM domain-containing protein [Staphylococcus schleiferi]UXR57112.1 PIN/TRAM domain-containing protein [Staphylococcus schleiferi]UXR59396.1 PIN/TRAM domain-containing protein [Staphylococcus schleiferi]UXR61710.1 PIN/TRAM domain-containing protein [Staphylococcus schleiferi]